jgi:hypothetical protein
METRSLWRELLETKNIETFLYELVGRADLSSLCLPTDSPSSLLTNERRFLLRLKWLLDSQRFAKILRPGRAIPIDKDILIRLLFHILALGLNNGGADGPRVSVVDQMVRRRLLLNGIVSGFRLLLMSGIAITTDEEDLLRSRLDDMVEIWNIQHELSSVELTIIPDLIDESMQNDEEFQAVLTLDIAEDFSVSAPRHLRFRLRAHLDVFRKKIVCLPECSRTQQVRMMQGLYRLYLKQ